jgi:hypothetical protein
MKTDKKRRSAVTKIFLMKDDLSFSDLELQDNNNRRIVCSFPIVPKRHDILLPAGKERCAGKVLITGPFR